MAALLCIAAGTVGSLLGAHAVARSDAAKARSTFKQSSAGIASSVKGAIQHEEDLLISASTFFAGNPKATPAEFKAWTKWVNALGRYPELKTLGLVALVRAPELPKFEERITGHVLKPQEKSSASTGVAPAHGGAFKIVPSGKRPYYCFASGGLSRGPATTPPAGLDYCAVAPALLASRDSGVSSYAPVSAGQANGLRVVAPVYRGFVAPSNTMARLGAGVGWLSALLVPKVSLQAALQDYPDYAVVLRYRPRTSHVVFTSGTPAPGAQRRTVNLQDGWTVESFGPQINAGVLADGHSLAVLVAGILMSLMLGLLVFLIGGGRAPVMVVERKELPHDDLYDALTGLPNRALILDRTERMLARAGRQSGLVVGALFIDVDWFKDVNEKLGQAAGDQLLRIVSERLETVMRDGDTVGRLEGDEFLVLVESAARGVRLDSLARRVIEALNKPVELEGFGPSFSLTASIGVAFGRYATPEELMRDARLAPDAPRQPGKNRYTLFNANMRSVIEDRGVLEVELNTAMQEKQFFLLYQPIYDLRTRKVVALEALIRWQHPKQGRSGARGLHPVGRGDRADRADRPLGARGGLQSSARHGTSLAIGWASR